MIRVSIFSPWFCKSPAFWIILLIIHLKSHLNIPESSTTHILLILWGANNCYCIMKKYSQFSIRNINWYIFKTFISAECLHSTCSIIYLTNYFSFQTIRLYRSFSLSGRFHDRFYAAYSSLNDIPDNTCLL